MVACCTMKCVVPPETTVTFAVIGEAVVFPIVKPITVACVAAAGAYTLAAVVPAFFKK